MQLDNPAPHNKSGKLKHVCVMYSKKSIIFIEELSYFSDTSFRTCLYLTDLNKYPVKIFCVEQGTHERPKKLNKQDNKPPPLKKTHETQS